MRRLVLYIRQCFCNHTWETEEIWYEHEGIVEHKTGFKIYHKCTICGYHYSHWKV